MAGANCLAAGQLSVFRPIRRPTRQDRERIREATPEGGADAGACMIRYPSDWIRVHMPGPEARTDGSGPQLPEPDVDGVMEVPILANASIHVVIIFIQGFGSIILAMALM